MCVYELTFMSGVVQVFSQVAAEHPLLQDPSLTQLLGRRPRLHERPQECYQLPVFLAHWFR